MSKKDQNNSKISSFITTVKDQLRTELQTTLSWLDTIDGKILFNGITTISPYIVGNPLGFLFPFIIESADMVVRQRFLKHLSDIGNKLKDKTPDLDMDFIQTLEGQQLLKDTFRMLIQENHDEKIEFLKKFLINSYIQSDLKEETKRQFLITLSSLSPTELILLRILFNPQTYIEEIVEKMKPNVEGLLAFSMKENIRTYMGLDEILFGKTISNLTKNDCISEEGKPTIWASGVYQPVHKNELISTSTTAVKALVTPYGNNFVKFVTRTL